METTAASELAKKLGVKESDLVSLSRSIVIAMEQDGIVDSFLSSDTPERVEFCKAYLIDAVKKFDWFVSKYLTNPEFRNLFLEYIRAAQS